MKKKYIFILIFICLAVILLKKNFYPAINNEISLGDTNILGDVNGDGKISIKDYIRIRKHLLGTNSLSSDEQKRADASQNGKIDNNDYVRIKNYLLYGTPVTKNISVTGIKLNKTNLIVEIGKDEVLSPIISPSNATDKTITWASSNSSVATVSNGVVKGIKAGNTIITATTSNGKSATCTVKVENKVIAITSISLNKTNIKLEIGKSEVINVVTTPSNATKDTITWTSSNPSVVTVDNGIVKGIKVGKAIITATTSNGKKAICSVTVEKSSSTTNGSNRIHFIKQASSEAAASAGGHNSGDAILLESNGHFAMVDTGLWDDLDSKFILNYLKSVGATKLDFVLITHAHTDHMGGLPYLIKKIPISKIYYKRYIESNGGGSKKLVNEVEKQAKAKGISITYVDENFSDGSVINLQNMKISLYNVKQNTYKTLHTDQNGEVTNIVTANSNSILELINVNGYKILLTGDFFDEAHNISYFNKKAKNEFKNIDLLKMPHHGGIRSAFGGAEYGIWQVEAFKNMNPKYVIVTNTKCGVCGHVGATEENGVDVRYANTKKATIYSFDNGIKISYAS